MNKEYYASILNDAEILLKAYEKKEADAFNLKLTKKITENAASSFIKDGGNFSVSEDTVKIRINDSEFNPDINAIRTILGKDGGKFLSDNSSENINTFEVFPLRTKGFYNSIYTTNEKTIPKAEYEKWKNETVIKEKSKKADENKPDIKKKPETNKQNEKAKEEILKEKHDKREDNKNKKPEPKKESPKRKEEQKSRVDMFADFNLDDSLSSEVFEAQLGQKEDPTPETTKPNKIDNIVLPGVEKASNNEIKQNTKKPISVNIIRNRKPEKTTVKAPESKIEKPKVEDTSKININTFINKGNGNADFDVLKASNIRMDAYQIILNDNDEEKRFIIFVAPLIYDNKNTTVPILVAARTAAETKVMASDSKLTPAVQIEIDGESFIIRGLTTNSTFNTILYPQNLNGRDIKINKSSVTPEENLIGHYRKKLDGGILHILPVSSENNLNNGVPSFICFEDENEDYHPYSDLCNGRLEAFNMSCDIRWKDGMLCCE